MVLCGGEVSGIVDARTATKEEIGLLTQAIQNNTLVMTELKDRLEDRRV